MLNMKALPLTVEKSWAVLKFFKSTSRSCVENVWDHQKSHGIRSTHAKYESPISYSKNLLVGWIGSLTSHSTIFSVIFVMAHTFRCAGGLKKKVDLWLGSQRHRHFERFLKVPVHNTDIRQFCQFSHNWTPLWHNGIRSHNLEMILMP